MRRTRKFMGRRIETGSGEEDSEVEFAGGGEIFLMRRGGGDRGFH